MKKSKHIRVALSIRVSATRHQMVSLDMDFLEKIE